MRISGFGGETRKSRGLITTGLFVLCVSMLTGCEDAEPIRIGFVGGLSGRSTDIGEASRNAVQLAVDEINADGGIAGHSVELLVRDDEDMPEVGAAAVRDLHAAGVAAIIGPNNSSIAAGMLPVLNELEVVTISPTASSLTLADLDDYLFRINWTTRDNARIYARHYLQRGITRVAVAIDGNNRIFSESWLQEFSHEFEATTGKVVTQDVFDANDERGYSDTARKLLDSNAEAILLVANSVDAAQLAQQIRKIDSEILLIAAEWAASERLIFLGGSAIEGLELVQSYDRSDKSEHYLKFHDAFRSQFQQEPGYSSIAAYDAATMLFLALERHESDGGTLKQALLNLGEVQGLQQPIKFNRFGDAKRQAFFVVVRDGGFEAR
jgi:branched-chain amino acid transport system substrate-binding protein